MDSKAIGYISNFVQGSVFNVYMNLLRVTRGILKDNILQHTAESHYFEHAIEQHSIAYVAFYVSACHQCQTNCNRWSSACIDAINYLLTGSLRENLRPRPCRIARSIWQGRGLRFSRKDRTFEVNKLFIIWLLKLFL